MTNFDRRFSSDELERLGEEIFDRQVRPLLKSEDDGKFVAIDVVTGNYEIDADDYTAVSRTRARNALAEIWLMRAGHATAYKMRRGT